MRKARIDANQPQLVELWRHMGALVQHIHTVGQGCPDVLLSLDGLSLVGQFNKEDAIKALKTLENPPTILAGVHLPIEIKAKLKDELTPQEVKWWQERFDAYGQKTLLARNDTEALALIGRSGL